MLSDAEVKAVKTKLDELNPSNPEIVVEQIKLLRYWCWVIERHSLKLECFFGCDILEGRLVICAVLPEYGPRKKVSFMGIFPFREDTGVLTRLRAELRAHFRDVPYFLETFTLEGWMETGRTDWFEFLAPERAILIAQHQFY